MLCKSPVGIRVVEGLPSLESASVCFLAGGLLHLVLYQKVEAGLFFWGVVPQEGAVPAPGPEFGI